MHIPMQDWLSAAAILGVLSALVGVFVSMRDNSRQMAVNVALEFSARMRTLVCSMPEEVWKTRLGITPQLPDVSLHLTVTVLQTLYQFLELFDFYHAGIIPRRIWNLWEADIESAIQSDLIRREWPRLREHFSTHVEFCRYIERLQSRTARLETRHV